MIKPISYYPIIFFIALVGYLLQTMMFLNGDVGSLLYDTKIFLNGGNYVTDFFETNPPMVFLLYTPVVWLAKWSAVNMIFIVRIYTIVWAIFSIGCCDYLLRKILTQSDTYLRFLLLYTLSFAYLLLPICEFGQREHFFLMLFMPYVFATILTAQNKKMPLIFAFLIGMLAALGVGMKPYFLAPLVLIELYLIVKKRSLWVGVRIPAVTCAGLLVAYLFWVFWRFPAYFQIILPLVSHLYYVGIKDSWGEFFSHLPVVFVLFVALHNVFHLNKPKKYPELSTILQLVLIGMIIAFTIPRAPWYYHLFPAISLACLFCNLCIYEFINNNRRSLWSMSAIIVAVSFAVPLFCFMIGTIYSINLRKNSDINQVVFFINSLPSPPTIYCFSSNSTGDCFTLIYLTQSKYGGRYPFFWWMKGLRRLEDKYPYTLPAQIKNDETYLINIFAEDLTHFQPDFFIINNYSTKNAKERFVKYFSKSPQFIKAWRPYRYYTSISSYEIYKRI